MLSDRERQKVCKTCKNHLSHSRHGVICSLTNDKPKFESSCPYFQMKSGGAIEKNIKTTSLNPLLAKKRAKAKRNIAIGGTFCVGGTIATIASEGMVVFYGAIIFGFVQLIIGIVSLSEAK